MYLAADVPEEEPSPPTPSHQKLPGMRPSLPDRIAQQQDATKEAAWQAYREAEAAQQAELYAQYLASDDPKFCADYMTVPIDPEVAAYEFPEDDPPPLPGPKRKRTSRARDSESPRKREKSWVDVPLEEPYTYQEKRYMAWTWYRLKLQDIEFQEKILAKQAKIDGLRYQLGITGTVMPYERHLPGDDLPQLRPHTQVIEFDLAYWIDQVRAKEKPVVEDVRMAPTIRVHLEQLAQERGPP